MGKKKDTTKTERQTVERWVHPKRRFVCIITRGVGLMTGTPYVIRECYKMLPDGRILDD